MLDCNVLIAGLLAPGGPPAELLSRWLEGEYELVASPALLAELGRVLEYPRIAAHVERERGERFRDLLAEEAVLASDPGPEETPGGPLPADPGDAYLVRLAVAERAAIVSGDRHLLAMRPEFPVHSPADFLAELEAQT